MKCPYCNTRLPNQSRLLRHVGYQHNGRGLHWRCMWPDCSRRYQTFISYRTLKRHLNNKHNYYLNAPRQQAGGGDDDDEDVEPGARPCKFMLCSIV